MSKSWNTARVAVLGGLLAVGTAIAVSGSAWAGGYDNNGRAYCDEDGYNCYQVRPGDRYGPEYRPDSRYDREDYRDGDRDDYRDGYYREGYDRDWHTVCDPDGDRCYRSSSGYWNYREYYRRLGYRWQD